jgi:uncharacterized Ntn-hydrolase superfamily protein
MTFSIVARCADTGQFGMAISSSSPAVAARCAHVRAGVGVVASQNITDPELGILTLDAMATGLVSDQAIAYVLSNRPYTDYRQLLAVDNHGNVAIHSGTKVLGTWSEAKGVNCAAAGNLLVNAEIADVMVKCFGATKGQLADRLLAALEAAAAAGGEAGPVHSAGLKVADKLIWPYIDLRADWSETPIADVRAAWDIYKPQAQAYVQRAIDPTQAPSYGVPGDR